MELIDSPPLESFSYSLLLGIVQIHTYLGASMREVTFCTLVVFLLFKLFFS